MFGLMDLQKKESLMAHRTQGCYPDLHASSEASPSDLAPGGGAAVTAPAMATFTDKDLYEEYGEEVVQTSRTAGQKPTLYTRIEAWISRLSSKNTFWHRVCSLIWLPYAFRSGIKMRRMGPNAMTAILPFRRVNRNWYNAMAGAALLGNTEIAGGMYVFGVCGGDYTVVCKELNYRFLRPCYGPAIYRMTPRENIHEQLKTSNEFNITLDMQILQMAVKPHQKERRVGKCEVTFHVTPKTQIRGKRIRSRN
jgi:hypothetical protein